MPNRLIQHRSSRHLFAFVCMAFITFFPIQSFALAKSEIAPVQDLTKEPAAYIVIDGKEGTIVSSKNIHKSLNVASTSKILTALCKHQKSE